MKRRQIRTAVLTFVLTFWAAIFFLRVGSALLVALIAAGLAIVVGRLDSDVEPELEPVARERRDGARGEVAELAWSLVGRDGRTGERALRRVREAAARRLARHGVVLTSPLDADRVRELVGQRAYVTLTKPGHPTPSLADLRHTLDALERLGPTARTTSESS
ncbi:hypothetical protein IC607_03920 [Cellulomonas sp. JH27-2]|uniref:hypothetical protein n=1 Tax=Cellulomonas sp. JH27-2 TaxID=2774139 RepID=UPI00178322BE|nr:hypothetical protein [Cellulomonas sp. JH27-2]MBD8058113.1 hypothetical protein [Cellulomonas sp. JH27-2]